MGLEVNWLAIGLASLSTLVIGSLWYAPKAFGSTWEELARIDKEHQAKPVVTILTAFVAGIVTAYVLAHLIYLSHAFFKNSLLQDAISTAFWVWLGLAACRFITHDSFEGRPRFLTLITIGHELLSLVVMAAIIGSFEP